MFALVTTLQNLTELEMMLPREEKVGLVGDHYHFNLLTLLAGDEACWCRYHHHHFDRPGCLRHWSLLQSLFCQVSELCSISFWRCLHCRNFCLFAILSLSFVYLYICTFFLAALAIDQRRIDAGRCVDWMEIIFMAITLMLKILIDCNNPDGNNLGGNWNLARRQ